MKVSGVGCLWRYWCSVGNGGDGSVDCSVVLTVVPLITLISLTRACERQTHRRTDTQTTPESKQEMKKANERRIHTTFS